MTGLLRAAGCAVLAVVLGGLGTVLVAPPASADESLYVAGTTTFSLQGRGYGHGHGMSQYGAYAAARAGLDHSKILDFYYPGTKPGSWSTSQVVRVKLTNTDAAAGYVLVRPNPGLRVEIPGLAPIDLPRWMRTDGSLTACSAAGTGCSAVVDYRIQQQSDGRLNVMGWYTSTSGAGYHYLFGSGPLAGPVASSRLSVTNPSTLSVEVVQADRQRRVYRGGITVLAPTASRSTILVRNDVTLESYLRSVVPAEMPASWSMEGLKAQAVAARTYALHAVRDRASAEYDVLTTTSDQVYNGVLLRDSAGNTVKSFEVARSDQAVAETAGKIRTYGGTPIFAQFGSSNGGYSTAGDYPYLVAKADPYDDRPDWSATLPLSTISTTYKIGPVQTITITSRDGKGAWGGRVTGIRFEGTLGAKTLTGEQLRPLFGYSVVDSSLFRLVPPPCVVDRISGQTLFDTNVATAKKSVPTSSNVVMASGDDAHLVDGLVAAPLAAKVNGPILLTARTSLPQVVKDEIIRRKTASGSLKVYMVGGPNAIATSVETTLKSLGVAVERVAGDQAYDTAVAVAALVGAPGGQAFIASMESDHLVDALSAGGVAARLGAPVLLTRKDSLPAATAKALQTLSVTHTYLAGGPNAVSDGVEQLLPGAERLFGALAPDTAAVIASRFRSTAGSPMEVMLASEARRHLVDALSAGSFRRPVLLTGASSLSSASATWLSASRGGIAAVRVIGGPVPVSDGVLATARSQACG